MQKTILFLISLLCLAKVFAQKTEITAALNSGLFSFKGNDVQSTTFMGSYNEGNGDQSFVSFPYGAKNGLSYGVSGKIAHISKRKIITGAEAGYEMLRSRMSVNEVLLFQLAVGAPQPNPGRYDATGNIFLNSQFINVHPFGGYRFVLKKINLDLTGGLDIAYCIGAMEKGEAKASDGKTYTLSNENKTIDIDFRPRLQIAAGYKRAGIYAGYSFGLVDYNKRSYINTGETRSRLIRFGLTYRIK